MYKHILLPVDLDHESSWRNALSVAVEHCEKFGAHLLVMTVVTGYFFPERVGSETLEEVDKKLQAFVKEHIPSQVTVQPIVTEGHMAYREILRVAKDSGVDLVIMASHHPGLKDYLLEPNAERVVRHSDLSVLIVRN